MIVVLRTETGGLVTNSFDTSSIPDTDAYWEALAGRVAEAMRTGRSGLAWLGAGRAAWLVAACMLAAAGVGVFARSRAAADSAPTFQLSMAPTDTIGRLVLGGQGPPAIASLAAMSTRGGRGAP